MKTKKLNRKQIKIISNTIAYHLLDQFDIWAFDDSQIISEEDAELIIDAVKNISKKYATDYISIGNTVDIVQEVRKGH